MRALILALASLLAASAFAGDGLVGKWQKGGETLLDLRSDGTGSYYGSEVRWQANDNALVLVQVQKDLPARRFGYALRGDKLELNINGKKKTLRRAGSKPAAAAKPRPEDQPDELTSLAVSSRWCRALRDANSGASKVEVLRFKTDGSWTSESRTKSYASGDYGNSSARADYGSGGRWDVRGAHIYMSEGANVLRDSGLEAGQDKEGFPTLTDGKKTYALCP